MKNAATANELNSNIGQDFGLAEAFDEDYAEEIPETTWLVTTYELVTVPARAAERPRGERVNGFLI